MIIDLHVHTSRGSGDSNLSPQEMVEEALRIGLNGVCLTEHTGPLDRFELRRFVSKREGLLVIPAIEVETDFGHITVFGLDTYVPGIRDLRELRAVADEVGAYVVLAHPFRNLFQNGLTYNNLMYKDPALYPRSAKEAAEHPVFEFVDAIEVANGATVDKENAFAWEVAHLLGKPMVGGSDAHSTHGLGKYVTVFSKPISSPEEFLYALHVGNFYPAIGLRTGELEPLDNHKLVRDLYPSLE